MKADRLNGRVRAVSTRETAFQFPSMYSD